MVRCSKCTTPIETVTEPKQGFIYLCNSCAMGWKEIKDKMEGHAYQDEVDKAFISYVKERPWTSPKFKTQ